MPVERSRQSSAGVNRHTQSFTSAVACAFPCVQSEVARLHGVTSEDLSARAV